MEIETTNGTLHYNVVKISDRYKGEVSHDLHKRFKGKVLRRYSKLYKTERGARNWLLKQIDIQKGK